MAAISFLAGSTSINNLAGSGLGFFGGSFGQSVQINQFQDTTYITDGAGTTQKGAANNVKYATDTTAYAPGIVPATGLKYIPNEKATLNIRFTNDSAVRTQNVKLRIFDRVNKNHAASGVITRVAEIIHPNTSYAVLGSGDDKWWGSTSHTGSDAQGTYLGSTNASDRLPDGTLTVGGSGVYVPLAQSPGAAGAYAGAGDTNTGQYTQHDWYVAITASPDSIGSKTQYGLYVELEYL
jgi:hypothetical protein|tara:strand:- start:4101 stop:4811 length:711 start_codon:yes stop_codon:yes gene_type:complete